jgi:hypothetical protein
MVTCTINTSTKSVGVDWRCLYLDLGFKRFPLPSGAWFTTLPRAHCGARILKQAILDARVSAIVDLLEELGQATSDSVAHAHDHSSANAELKLDELGEALSQAAQSLRRTLASL